MLGFGKRKKQLVQGRWVPLGEVVSVRGRQIPGGIFVGEDIASVSDAGRHEPALIRPSLKVQNSRPDTAGQLMGYWPSYSEIQPASRAAYLDWLAHGRPGGAYIGYVFLFFYGIERKLICEEPEDANRAERAQLLDEVRRLLRLYPESGSFQRYASDFLTTMELRENPLTTDDLTPPTERTGWDIPLEVKLAIGSFSFHQEPVPVEWAHSWVATGYRLKTAATRCPDEFLTLFARSYRDKFGEGIVVPNDGRTLEWDYRAASPSFFGATLSVSTPEIADISGSEDSLLRIAEVADTAAGKLGAYSRYLGRNDNGESIEALALLPPELAKGRAPKFVREFATRVPLDGFLQVSSDELTQRFFPGKEKLTKKEAVTISSLLASQGVAIEPDARVGMANLSKGDSVILWKDSDPSADPGDGFLAASVLVHLGATVSASDGEVSSVEMDHIESGIEDAIGLPPEGKRRLRAHLEWLVTERPGNAGVKARTKEMDYSQRSQIANFMIAIAGADGRVSPEEVDSMKRLYKLLGLEAEAIHSDLHAMSSGGPSKVIDRDRDPGDFSIPPAQAEKTGVQLNPDRLAHVMSSTDEVQEILTDVFKETEAKVEPEPSPEEEPEPFDSICGLDETHSDFIRLASVRPSWPAHEMDELARDLGLMRSGAIETVNEATFEACEAPLFEGSDPVEVDPYVVKELLNG